jgi:hypothetical protein
MADGKSKVEGLDNKKLHHLLIINKTKIQGIDRNIEI